jgi:uncharacterized membrane protein
MIIKPIINFSVYKCFGKSEIISLDVFLYFFTLAEIRIFAFEILIFILHYLLTISLSVCHFKIFFNQKIDEKRRRQSAYQ